MGLFRLSFLPKGLRMDRSSWRVLESSSAQSFLRAAGLRGALFPMIQLSGLLGLEPSTSLRRGDKGCRGLAAGLARMQKIQKLVVALQKNKFGPEPRRSKCCRQVRSMQLSTESLSRVEAEESFRQVRAATHKSFKFTSRLVYWRSLWYGIMRWRLKDFCWASDVFGLRVRLASLTRVAEHQAVLLWELLAGQRHR